MLGPGRYLLGVVELLWLVGFAWLGAAQVRRRWVPRLKAEAAFLSTLVIAVALLLWVAEALDRSEASDTPLRPWPAYRNRVNTRILPNSGQNLRDLAVLTGQLSGSSIFDSPPTKLDRARLRP